MFESEIGFTPFNVDELPGTVLSKFKETAKLVGYRSQIPWAEHCSECMAPSCFSTCEFYDPRPDMKCRRFTGGFYASALDATAAGNLIRVTFDRWGKLEGRGRTELLPTADAVARESLDLHIGKMISEGPVPFGAKVYLTRARQRRKAAHRNGNGNGSARRPNFFVVEAYNPAAGAVTATLSIRPPDPSETSLFQHLLHFEPGYNRALVPYDAIAARFDLARDFLVQIEPHEAQEGVTLYFGLIDFAHVEESAAAPRADAAPPIAAADAPRIKCVIWDLDNTLWKGTLVEDGADGIVLNQQALETVRELDRRGILNSIASKNNAADALAALERLGIREYFLCPQISWGPKSSAVAEIARRLNLGINAMAFIDDQPFELAEVRSVHPDVLALEESGLAGLLDGPRFDVPVTAESRQRRSLYQVEMEREEALKEAGGDYLDFLRTCRLEITVSPLTADVTTRVYELAQRTNQMNFSGNRYTQANIEAIRSDGSVDTYVISARDRFGDYGIVGFSLVERATATMRDLMFSCRIQAKHVDRAFLTYLVNHYVGLGQMRFTALYRETERNRPASQLFWDIGFEEVARAGDLLTLTYDVDLLGSPQQDIVKVAIG